MPNPRPLSSLRGGYDDPPASDSSTPRTRRSRLHRALQSTNELAREVVSMVEAEQRAGRPSASNSRRRQRSPSTDRDTSQDPGTDGWQSVRFKRRKLEPHRSYAPRPSIRYGHYGQVEPGKLKLELVSCDGGEHTDSRHPQTYLGAKNLLRHDKSVYCSERPSTNIILRHADDSPFCLEKLHIVGPENGFTAPVREGVVYIAMSLNDLQKYIDPPAHARRATTRPPNPPQTSVLRNENSTRRHVYLSPEPLTLLDALHDPEINAALDTRHRDHDRQVEHEDQREEDLNYFFHFADDPSSAYVDPDTQCDNPSSEDPDGWASEDGIVPVTLLSDEETGPEDSTPQEVIDFLQHRRRLMRRRYEIENWDREESQWNTQIMSGEADERAPPGYNLSRLDAMMARSRVYDSPHPRNAESNEDAGHHLPPLGSGQSAEREAANDPNVTCARFQIKYGRHKVAIKFVPEVSGRYMLIKLWAGRNNVDVQSIIAKGYGGLRFFPAMSVV